jgi:hypothetical protein
VSEGPELPTIPLAHKLNVRAFGGDNILWGDFNDDGLSELIFIQSAGMLSARAFTPRLFDGKHWIQPQDQALFSMTSTTLAGEVLWQVGKPWRKKRPWRWHGGQRGMYQVADLNRDGKLELAIIRGKELQIFSASDGALLKKIDLPEDNFCLMVLVPMEGGMGFLAGCGDKSYSPWVYGNPVVFYDPQGKTIWGPRHIVGAGHSALAFERDGQSELIVGYNRMGLDGKAAWTINYPNPSCHVDDVKLADLDEDGVPEVFFAGGHDVLAASLDGKILWINPLVHPQRVTPGRFMLASGEITPPRTLVHQIHHGRIVHAFDINGAEIWQRDILIIATTPLAVPGANAPVLLATYRGRRFPIIADGDLVPLAKFEGAEEAEKKPYVMENEWPHHRADFGRRLHSAVLELTFEKDQPRPYILIHDREEVWIYEVPKWGELLRS